MERENTRIEIVNQHPEDSKAVELQRLLECYQLANHDDQCAVWAVLNKYCRILDAI